jgi:TPR repeat protein
MSDVLPPKTAELARNAAKPDQVVTIIGMSLLGDHGRVVTRDSLSLLYVAAMAGNADAQFAISIAYRHGQAVGRSDTEANLWMRKAADSGSIKACVELAYDLWKGTEGQTVDLSSAAHFTIIAANGRGSKG